MKQIILRLLGLLALIGISYGLARLLVSAWTPGEGMQLVLVVALLILALPLAYWALYRHYRYTDDIPYFLLRLDFLLRAVGLSGNYFGVHLCYPPICSVAVGGTGDRHCAGAHIGRKF